MKISRILAPVHSLGPGERLCLWTVGCGKHCADCISPELQSWEAGCEIDETMLAGVLISTARSKGITALTISGGDPFEQSGALLRLLKQLRPQFQDILVYTGYTLDEIRQGRAGPNGEACLDWLDVLIDGPYIRERNTPDCVLRGSSNQNIHIFSPALVPHYEACLARGRTVETFTHGSQTIITGILNERSSAS